MYLAISIGNQVHVLSRVRDNPPKSSLEDNKQGNRSVDGPKKNAERDHEHNPQPSPKHDCLYIKKHIVPQSTAITCINLSHMW